MKPVILAIAILAWLCLPARALYCGTSLVILGQTQDQVLQICGAPAFVSGRFETRPGAGWSPWLRDHPLIANYGLYYDMSPFASGVVEEWVYNFGPTRMMPRLVFENGVLASIRYHGYGR